MARRPWSSSRRASRRRAPTCATRRASASSRTSPRPTTQLTACGVHKLSAGCRTGRFAAENQALVRALGPRVVGAKSDRSLACGAGVPPGLAPRIDRMPVGKAKASVPGRSREQRLGALQQANEIRSARAKLKKDLASGKLELARVLAQPPACARTARVRDILLVLPKIGSVRAGRILAQAGIAHSKTLGGLTDRQRAELVDLFRR